MRIFFAAALAFSVMINSSAFARGTESDTLLNEKSAPQKVQKSWYDKIQLRGYAQVRYNGLIETNPNLKCSQCDKSWGGDGGFFIRRARLVFSGQVHERVYVYFQPDFASGGQNLLQVRDLYFDLGLDAKNEFRLRIGQSKVPFGFDNLQSSSERVPLDRSDPINSAAFNERDLGVFFYYAPAQIKSRFKELTSLGLKGSGDYGVIGFGVYNGQTANLPEANGNRNVVGRLTYPFKLNSGQYLETSFQALTGKFIVNRNPLSNFDQVEFREYRFGPSFILYPQPFGIQAEFNWGRGPKFDSESGQVLDSPLKGGYVTGTYLLKNDGDVFIPYARYQYYDGGKRFELDAMSYLVKELEFGVEWQPNKAFELVVAYAFSNRTMGNTLNPVNSQQGSLLRLQAQVNF